MAARIRRFAALLAAALVMTAGCAHQTPSISGAYSSKDGSFTDKLVPAETPKIPVVLRYVAIEKLTALSPEHPQRAVALTAAQREQFTREFLPALTRDLYHGGRFRPPEPGEEPYKLDLWFTEIGTRVGPGYTVMTVVGTLLLGLPFLLGAPTQRIRAESEIHAQLIAPSGVLVLQTDSGVYRPVHRGVYYGGASRRSLGDAVAPVVDAVKFESSLHWRDISDQREYLFWSVKSFYEPGPKMLAGMLTPDPYTPRGIVPHLDPKRPHFLGDPPNDPTAVQVATSGDPAPPSVAVAPPHQPAPFLRATPQPATFVLSIGIDRYRDAPRALGAEDDARRVDQLFAETFAVPTAHRRLLLGDRATRSDIDHGLRWLADNVRKGGRAVVYFSGHGAPDAATGAPYLVPYEVDPAAISESSLQLADVERRLAALPIRDVVLVIDACFSGTGPRSIAPTGARPLVFVDPTAQVVRLAAAGVKESAGTTAAGDGGLFTHYLLQALGDGKADTNGDGQVTFVELDAWLIPRVAAAARTLGRTQTPSFQSGSKRTDDIVLGWGYPID